MENEFSSQKAKNILKKRRQNFLNQLKNHDNLEKSEKTDDFINWVNANQATLGLRADICKLQSDNENFDPTCDQISLA